MSKIALNSLIQIAEPKIETLEVNGASISVSQTKSYDELIKDILLASNILINSGDRYVFSFNLEIIRDLILIKAFTDIDLDFLEEPDIKLSSIIEAYDILQPLILSIKQSIDSTILNFYEKHVAEVVAAENTYRNSAKGIVDALSESNILQQQTMLEQLNTLDDEKLSLVMNTLAAHDKGATVEPLFKEDPGTNK